MIVGRVWASCFLLALRLAVWSVVAMDILKELFGTCDELHISKALFGTDSGSGQVEALSAPGELERRVCHL